MAYLVVIVVDNSPFQAGDVISYRDENMLSEAGHYGIGTKTLQDERFKIVHCPDMTVQEANLLCRPQAGFNPSRERGNNNEIEFNPDAKARAWNLNLSKLPVQKKADIATKNKSKNERFRMKPDSNGSHIPEMLDVINLSLTKEEGGSALELKPAVDNRVGAFVRELR